MHKNLGLFLFKTFLMALLYYATGKISIEFFQKSTIIITPFIPEGFALAAALLYGRSVLPGIFLGQFLFAVDSGLLLLPAAGISAVNTAEAYLAILLFRYLSFDRRLTSLKDLFTLFGIILFVLQPFSSLASNSFLSFFDPLHFANFYHNVFLWWFGNIMGQIMFTPMLLLFYAHRHQLQWRYFAYLTLLVVLWDYLLQVTLGISNVSLLLMLTLPFVIYLITIGLTYALFAALVLSGTNLYLTHLGIGTFTRQASLLYNMVDLNFYILSNVILVLLIGILFKEKENAIHTLKSMAHYDFLTGLPNRYLLREEIHHTVYLAHEEHAKSAVCYIDLDGFKPINDTYGHRIGDKVLKEIVLRVKPFTRSEDAFLRIGGDEFLVIFNHVSSKEALDRVLEKMLASVSKTMQIEGHEIQLSFSIGVAWCPAHGTTVEALMHTADNAMYAAKKEGKNRFVYAEGKH